MSDPCIASIAGVLRQCHPNFSEDFVRRESSHCMYLRLITSFVIATSFWYHGGCWRNVFRSFERYDELYDYTDLRHCETVTENEDPLKCRIHLSKYKCRARIMYLPRPKSHVATMLSWFLRAFFVLFTVLRHFRCWSRVIFLYRFFYFIPESFSFPVNQFFWRMKVLDTLCRARIMYLPHLDQSLNMLPWFLEGFSFYLPLSLYLPSLWLLMILGCINM